MRRRDFVMLVGGAVTWPLTAKAQQPRNDLRRIAFLAGSSSGSGKDLVGCFTSGLRDLGWIEGENITVDIRWSEGVEEKYAALVAEMASAHLDLVVVTSTPGTLAAKHALHDTPVVFIGVSDPVKSGIVASLSRPGSNITGVSNFLPQTSGKLIELLAQVAPGRTRFGVLHNPDNPGKLIELGDLQTEGKTIGIKIEPIEVRSANDFPNAFAKISQTKCGALIVLQEGVTLGGRREILEFLEKAKLPSIFQIKEFVEAGGLMSYGLNYCQHFGRGAVYVDKILKGAHPADLPVELPTKFELVINLRTAKALDLDIPTTLLATADQVIE